MLSCRLSQETIHGTAREAPGRSPTKASFLIRALLQIRDSAQACPDPRPPQISGEAALGALGPRVQGLGPGRQQRWFMNVYD
jgi:hypothetical protein